MSVNYILIVLLLINYFMKHFFHLFLIFGYINYSFAQSSQSVETAQFKGGYGDFLLYIQQNIRISKLAKKKKFNGVVNVKFTVNKSGTIENVVLLEEDKYQLKEPIEALLLKMPKWRPAKINWSTVPCIINETLTFNDQMNVYNPIEKQLKYETLSPQKEVSTNKQSLKSLDYQAKLLEYLSENLNLKKNKMDIKGELKFVCSLEKSKYSDRFIYNVFTGVSEEFDNKISDLLDGFHKIYTLDSYNSTDKFMLQITRENKKFTPVFLSLQ